MALFTEGKQEEQTEKDKGTVRHQQCVWDIRVEMPRQQLSRVKLSEDWIPEARAGDTFGKSSALKATALAETPYRVNGYKEVLRCGLRAQQPA